MKITKRQGRACLDVMKRIVDDGDPINLISAEMLVSDALHALGWMDSLRDYFDYTDGCANCGITYRPSQVLTALAMAAAISGCGHLQCKGQESAS